MNKKQITAVKKTVKMWEWLRDNPTKEKIDYFITLPTDTKLPEGDFQQCYLCDIWCDNCSVENRDLDVPNLNCDCPLATKTLHCDFGTNSPFDEWCSNKESGAQRIVNACNRWLRKYDV